jgi:beta-galactosidase
MTSRPPGSTSGYLFGAVYLLEPEYSWSEVERDVNYMAEMGFNLLTLWPVANSWLARDPSEFVFDDTIRFLDLCHSKGMKVLLQLVGQNPSQEFTPDCLLRPDMLLHPLPGSIWANLNHPEVEALALRYFDSCVAALKHHPAVFGWDLFNESNFRSTDPHTIRKYQSWLEQRYGTIENLNRKWLRRFRDFGQIDPSEHRAIYSVWSSLLPPVEIEAFHAENLTAICRSWCEHVKMRDPDHPVIIDGTSAQLLETDLSLRNCDEYEVARTCDIYGGTFYPKSWGRNLGDKPWELFLYYSIPRGAAVKAGKPYFIDELQTHTQSLLTPGSEMLPRELELCIWAAIAAGGNAVQLWRWRPFLRGYQSTGRGLTLLDGTPGPRGEAVGRLVRSLRRIEGELGAVKPAVPDVTVMLGYRSRLFYDAFLRGAPSHHPETVRGWHRAFTALGLEVETGSIEHLDDRDLATPIIVLPALVSLDDGQVAWLENYVRQGGLLIAEARLNALDSWDRARTEGSPGKLLANVFGVIEGDVGPASSFLWDGVPFKAPFLIQHLTANAGTSVLARNAEGHPMVVSNRYGSGQTIYFAAIQGFAWQSEASTTTLALLRSCVDSTRVAHHFVRKPEMTIVRWHEGQNRIVAYVMNFDSADSEVRFAQIPAMASRELISGAPIAGDKITLPPQSVRIVEWTMTS